MLHSHISLRLHLNVADHSWKDLTVFGWHFYPLYLSSIYPLLKILHGIRQGQQLWGVGCSSLVLLIWNWPKALLVCHTFGFWTQTGNAEEDSNRDGNKVVFPKHEWNIALKWRGFPLPETFFISLTPSELFSQPGIVIFYWQAVMKAEAEMER